MNYHLRAEVFRNSLPGRKNVVFPCTFIGKVFYQYAQKVIEWEPVIDPSELLFDDAILAFCLRHVFLSCSIVHRDGRIELCYKRIKTGMKLVVTEYFCDLETAAVINTPHTSLRAVL